MISVLIEGMLRGGSRRVGICFCKGIPIDDAQIRYVHLDSEGRITERTTFGRY